MLAKAREDGAEMLSVLPVTLAGHLKVVLEGETEKQLVLHPIHLSQEGDAGVAETEGHPGVLEQPKWCRDGGLQMSSGCIDLMISLCHDPSAFCTMCSGDAQGLSERQTTPSFSSCSNSSFAALSFSSSR